jgi:predicted transcriptional regulator
MKYRSRTDIVLAILEAAANGATQIKIMYNAFLSYAQAKEYLSVLLANGLIEYIAGELVYRTTSKGMKLLEQIRNSEGITLDLVNDQPAK